MATKPLTEQERAIHPAWVLLFGIALLGCEDNFTPYNELESFRLLAMQAEPPWLAPEATSRFSALVHSPVDAPVDYRWTWCPITEGPEGGYSCAFSAEDLQTTFDEAVGPGLITVPRTELGTSSTAVMRQTIPASALSGACDALVARALPLGVGFDCEQGFDVTIRLDVTQGEQTIAAIKELRWVFVEEEVHNNPAIRGLSLTRSTTPKGPVIDLPAGGAPEIELSVEYEMLLDVRPDESERYVSVAPEGGAPVERREQLIFTWFVETGEMDSARTTFIEAEIPLSAAVTNLWIAPEVDPVPGSVTRFYVVVRDGRGGLSWIQRAARFGAAQ